MRQVEDTKMKALYEEMGIEFPLKDTPEAKQDFVDEVYKAYEKALG